MAVALGLSNVRTIEVLRPKAIPDGFAVEIHIHLNYIFSREIKYRKLIENMFSSGRMVEILKNAWGIKGGLPLVMFTKNDLFEVESRERKRNIVDIEMSHTKGPGDVSIPIGAGGNVVNP